MLLALLAIFKDKVLSLKMVEKADTCRNF